MDYKQLILAALEKDDWAEIMNIASKARGELAEESYFGMKKGFVNIMDNDFDGKLKEYLKLMGVKVYSGHYNQIMKRHDKGEITDKTIQENYVVVITRSDNLKGLLAEKNMPSVSFSVGYTSNKWEKRWNPSMANDPIFYKFTIENIATKEQFLIDESVAKGLLREKNIDSILDDL
jgi:hypothetical protein